MQNRILIAVNLVLAAALSWGVFSSWKKEGSQTGTGIFGPEKEIQTVRTFDLAGKTFSFCGEIFPIENPDVYQRIDRELVQNVYSHSSTIMHLKRANALFPVIEPILKEEGVPDDLKYLAVAESGLTNAISPANAKGYWQFISSAADQYDLEISKEIDERYHIEKSTRAAARYMRDLQKRLGSWVSAAAAYNGGLGRITEESGKQRAKNFWELNLAADETMRYPFRIAAIKEVMENPSAYEYVVEKDHLYEPLGAFSLVEVAPPVENWGDWAARHGMTYRELKIWNPWILGSTLSASKTPKTYSVKVPKK